jgi:hypothetical protein
MMALDPLDAEAARSAAWAEEHAALARRFAVLSPIDARHLAFQLVTVLLRALLSDAMKIALGEVYAVRMADVVAIVAALGRAIASDMGQGPPGLATLCGRADALHARLFVLMGPRGTWPDEARLPAEAAEAVRRACEPDALDKLPVLYTGAKATLARCELRPEDLDALVEEALRHAALVRGLDGLVQDAPAQPKGDVVPQALHVVSGAQAVDALRRQGPRRDDDDEDGARVPFEPRHDPATEDERVWCRDLAARAAKGAFTGEEPAR